MILYEQDPSDALNESESRSIVRFGDLEKCTGNQSKILMALRLSYRRFRLSRGQNRSKEDK